MNCPTFRGQFIMRVFKFENGLKMIALDFEDKVC